MKFSIITISLNSSKYLERAIESVINQDHKNWEHIIIDGGSTDNTTDILKKYDHLKWISEPDKGQSDAMNKGFKMSDGDIIGYLNADDYYRPNIFKSVIDAFKTSKEEIVVGDILIETSEGIEKRSPTTKYLEVIDYSKDLFPANPVSYFYKREVQLNYGYFPLDNHMTMDLDFIYFAYKNHSVKYIPKEFGTFYIDGDNKTSMMNVREEQKKVLLQFLWKHDRQLYFRKKFQASTFAVKKTIKGYLTKLRIV